MLLIDFKHCFINVHLYPTGYFYSSLKKKVCIYTHTHKNGVPLTFPHDMPHWLWRTLLMEWVDSILYMTESKILYLKTWALGQGWLENFKLFLYNNQCTLWEKLSTNQIHSIFQIPGRLINSHSDKQTCLYYSLTSSAFSHITKHPRPNFSLGSYGITLHLYKTKPRVFAPRRIFFLCVEQIQIYTSINQNKSLV